jgi:TPP-dependent pyruvate/acetoin dehydrogenase alpha subunit
LSYTVEELREFESEVITHFEAGEIRGPVHLSYGNEEALIEIFQNVKPDDWVFSTWRNHYHALLKGIPRDWLMGEVLAGRSINICNPEYKFHTSAIVGGIIPIAVGAAAGIKRNGGKEHVWCFIGDMAFMSGIFHESYQYARYNNLPITFVVEDNFLSTNSITLETWGIKEEFSCEFHAGHNVQAQKILQIGWSNVKIYYYWYKRKYPHVGSGHWIHF